jgi:Domain of unknown function (DUF4232)
MLGRKRVTTRRSLAALAAALASLSLATLAIAGRSAAPRMSHASAAGVPGCATNSLVVWLDTNGDAAAGSVHYELQFTNLSSHSCVLRGYPGVSAVDLAGHRLGAPAARNARTPVRAITLAPRVSASAALQIADTDVFPSTTCRATTAAGLRVFPPNETASKVVPYPFRACTRPGPTYLQVGTVTKATRP